MNDTDVGSERHRFCPSCGTEAVTGGSFCSVCGAKIDVVAEADGAAQSSNPTWDFSGWDDAIAGELTDALVELEIPHRWDGPVLSTDPDDEVDVDALLDELAGLPQVQQSEVSTDVATANLTQPSSEVARKRRRWLWPVGAAVVLLVAAGIIFGVPQIRHDVLRNGSTPQGNFGEPCSQNPACRNSGNSGSSGSGSSYTQPTISESVAYTEG